MKYKIFERGQFRRFSEEIPLDMPIVGVSGFKPVSNGLHYLAAGYDYDNLPKEERRKPSHINPPYAEKI